MNVPFWDPKREYFAYEFDTLEAIKSCLKQGELVLGFGDKITELERRFAEYVGTKHAIMCGGGTHALLLSYRALGLKGNWNYLIQLVNENQITLEEAEARFEGDEVITTSHTFIATIDQIVACGAKPVLVDIDETGLIDPQLIKKAITDKTKAIVPVHLEGKICDMEAINKIAKEHDLYVIEDAAQALGAYIHDLDYKTGSYGHLGCFSLYPAKIIGGIGNAGMVTTDDDRLAERVRMLRCNYNIGRANKDIETSEYGYQLEPDSIIASVLLSKMDILDAKIKKRNEIAKRYDEDFRHLYFIKPLEQEGRVYQDYVIRLTTDRGRFIEHMEKEGVSVRGCDLIPNHLYKKLHLNSNLPLTELYLSTQVRLPCNPFMTEAEIEHVISSVKKFYAQ